MTLFARLLAGLGLHSAAVAAPAPPSPSLAFEHQLWRAQHVVRATILTRDNRSTFRPTKLYKGDPAKLAFPLETPSSSRQGDVIMLLFGPSSEPAIFPLNFLQRFPFAPNRVVSLSELERILSLPPFHTRACHSTVTRGDYVLCTEILHAGTRSQGRRGTLYHAGVEVKGDKPGQTLDQFLFLGNERPHLWSVSGWDLPSNPRPPGN